MVRSQQPNRSPHGLTISELARAGGVGVETVRDYQRRGLIADPRPSRAVGAPGRRHYGQDDVARLHFVREAQVAGFTLAEIAELAELDSGRDRDRARGLAQARIAAIDERIAALQSARARLARLAEECAASGSSDKPCPIVAAFQSA
jgi:MerR family mercuric resistance operon transcriptional regulator